MSSSVEFVNSILSVSEVVGCGMDCRQRCCKLCICFSVGVSWARSLEC